MHVIQLLFSMNVLSYMSSASLKRLQLGSLQILQNSMTLLNLLYNNVSNGMKGFLGSHGWICLFIILCELKGSLQSKYPQASRLVYYALTLALIMTVHRHRGHSVSSQQNSCGLSCQNLICLHFKGPPHRHNAKTCNY